LKINKKFSAGLRLVEDMLQSLAILYAEYALARDKVWQNFQRFCRQKSRRSPTMYSNRLNKVTGC